jgi:hypothetical protein
LETGESGRGRASSNAAEEEAAAVELAMIGVVVILAFLCIVSDINRYSGKRLV